MQTFNGPERIKKARPLARHYHDHNKAHVDLETDVPSLPFLCCLILSSIKRKPLGHPPGRAPVPWSSPSLRASWRSGCRVWHRTQGHLLTLQGENTESIAAVAVELWWTSAAGVVSGKSALVCVCTCVRACSAAVPCCTGRLSILVQRRAKRIGEILHLLQSCGCLSPSVPRLWGTNAAGPSATSPLHQRRLVFAFFFDVMLRCFAHVKGEWDRLASSWIAISGVPLPLNCDPINGSFGTIADIWNYRRKKAVFFFNQAAPGVAFRRPGMSRFDLGFQTASAVQCVDLHEYHI